MSSAVSVPAAGERWPMIELQGVSKEYQDGTLQLTVLRRVDISVAQGETVALLGPSGCGKSTLLNILGCLDRPSEGVYRLSGQDVSHLSREQEAWVRLHHIGFVFQSFHLIAHASALENVALPLYYAGVPRKQREARARQMLERVGLGDRLQHRPHQLSGGQRQRTAIARACVTKPKLLLADEPTGALDTKSGHEVLALMGELHAETGMTLVIVTHDSGVAATAQRRIEMSDGRVVAVHGGESQASVDG